MQEETTDLVSWLHPGGSFDWLWKRTAKCNTKAFQPHFVQNTEGNKRNKQGNCWWVKGQPAEEQIDDFLLMHGANLKISQASVTPVLCFFFTFQERYRLYTAQIGSGKCCHWCRTCGKSLCADLESTTWTWNCSHNAASRFACPVVKFTFLTCPALAILFENENCFNCRRTQRTQARTCTYGKMRKRWNLARSMIGWFWSFFAGFSDYSRHKYSCSRHGNGTVAKLCKECRQRCNNCAVFVVVVVVFFFYEPRDRNKPSGLSESPCRRCHHRGQHRPLPEPKTRVWMAAWPRRWHSAFVFSLEWPRF